MARISRAVFPGLPHHVTQRGNRRQQTFFSTDDYLRYVELLAGHCDRFRVAIWAWCLMPNHVHVVAVPETADGLRWALGETHRQYTLEVFTGRPLGSDQFVDSLESRIGRVLRPGKAGRPPTKIRIVSPN